jgi:hypothetical protein
MVHLVGRRARRRATLAKRRRKTRSMTGGLRQFCWVKHLPPPRLIRLQRPLASSRVANQDLMACQHGIFRLCRAERRLGLLLGLLCRKLNHPVVGSWAGGPPAGRAARARASRRDSPPLPMSDGPGEGRRGPSCSANRRFFTCPHNCPGSKIGLIMSKEPLSSAKANRRGMIILPRMDSAAPAYQR